MAGRLFFGSRWDGEDTKKENPTWKALRYEDRTEAHVHKVLAAATDGKGSGNGSGNGSSGKKKGAEAAGAAAGASLLKPPKLAPLKKGDVPPSSVGGGTDVRELFCDVVIVGSGAGAWDVAGFGGLVGWWWRAVAGCLTVTGWTGYARTHHHSSPPPPPPIVLL
jgi:hypothetical protein